MKPSVSFAMVTVTAQTAKPGAAKFFFAQRESADFKRLGHLEAQPLLGGDLASRYPVRVAAGMLSKAGVNVDEWLTQKQPTLALRGNRS